MLFPTYVLFHSNSNNSCYYVEQSIYTTILRTYLFLLLIYPLLYVPSSFQFTMPPWLPSPSSPVPTPSPSPAAYSPATTPSYSTFPPHTISQPPSPLPSNSPVALPVKAPSRSFICPPPPYKRQWPFRQPSRPLSPPPPQASFVVSESSANKEVLVGFIIGGAVVGVIIMLLIFCFRKKEKRIDHDASPPPPHLPPVVPKGQNSFTCFILLCIMCYWDYWLHLDQFRISYRLIILIRTM